MKNSLKQLISMFLVFILISSSPFGVLAKELDDTDLVSLEEETVEEENIVEDMEALEGSDASFSAEENDEKNDIDDINEESATEEATGETESESSAEIVEAETTTEMETLQDNYSLYGQSRARGKIVVDGNPDDWAEVAKRTSNDSEIAYWQVAFDGIETLYFCFSGDAPSEWYSSYQWKSITLFGENGFSETRQISGGWSISDWGANVVVRNTAHLNSAGTYFVEISFPASYFKSHNILAIQFAQNTVRFEDIEVLDNQEIQPPKDEDVKYEGIVIDGLFSDWKAVEVTDVSDSQINRAAMIFDGDNVYIYMEETGDATNAGPQSNGMFVITTDLNHVLKFQLKNPNVINGVEGAIALHVGNKWEISIPKRQLPLYKDCISFGLFLEEPWVKNISNLDGSSGSANQGGSNTGTGICYDGYFDDWNNYPHTQLNYSTAGSTDYHSDGEGALYCEDTTLFGHVVTQFGAHLEEAGGEFTSAVTIRFNDEASMSFSPRFVTVDGNGTINWNPQLSGLSKGKHEFYIASLDAWGSSTNINQLYPDDTMYGKITISIGETKDEAEYYIDLEKIAEKYHCNPNELKVIAAQYGRIGQQWVTTAGATSLPWVILMICLMIVWLYLLKILRVSKLYAWRFLIGSLGWFVFLITLLKDVFLVHFSRIVAALAGILGNLFGAYSTYFKYGIIFIPTNTGSMTLQIDFECSGIIEVFAFFALLTFFDLYKRHEKIIIGLIGFTYIMVSNSLRISLICFVVHYFGNSSYYLVHAIIGRLFFYVLSVMLYFYVFTKPQTVRMKVGQFSYDVHKKTT